MVKPRFIDAVSKKPLVDDIYIYIWSPETLPSSSEFPSKKAGKPLICGKTASEGELIKISNLGCDPDFSFGNDKEKRVLLLRSSRLFTVDDLSAVTKEDVMSVDLKPVTELKDFFPSVEFRFYALYSPHTKQGTKPFIGSYVGTVSFVGKWFSYVRLVWEPKSQDLKKMYEEYKVTFKWDGKVKLIDDKDGNYDLIEFPKGGAPDKAFKLIKDNWSNPHGDPVIPVFICRSAWVQRDEGMPKRPGALKGYTFLKNREPGAPADMERAIFLFSSAADQITLAHEMSHWVGFDHGSVGRDNIGQLYGGVKVIEEQYYQLHRWAQFRNLRMRRN